MEIAAILTAVAAVIGAVTGLATVIAPFLPRRPAPDTRTKAQKLIDRLSMVPTGIWNGKKLAGEDKGK